MQWSKYQVQLDGLRERERENVRKKNEKRKCFSFPRSSLRAIMRGPQKENSSDKQNKYWTFYFRHLSGQSSSFCVFFRLSLNFHILVRQM